MLGQQSIENFKHEMSSRGYVATSVLPKVTTFQADSDKPIMLSPFSFVFQFAPNQEQKRAMGVRKQFLSRLTAGMAPEVYLDPELERVVYSQVFLNTTLASSTAVVSAPTLPILLYRPVALSDFLDPEHLNSVDRICNPPLPLHPPTGRIHDTTHGFLQHAPKARNLLGRMGFVLPQPN